MGKIHKAIWIICWTLLFNQFNTLPANALLTTATIDMNASTFIVTDLDASDNINPFYSLSNRATYASVWQNDLFTHIPIGGGVVSSSNWTTNLLFTHSPGGTGSADWTDGVGTTSVSGYDYGFELFAYCTRYAEVTLSGNTKLEISVPVSQMVDPMGSDPTLGKGQGPEAYAGTQLMAQTSEWALLDYDYLGSDHWNSGTLFGTLKLTILNESNANMNILFEAQSFSKAMSYAAIGPEPVPEPTAILLFGAGIAGLAAARRRKEVG